MVSPIRPETPRREVSSGAFMSALCGLSAMWAGFKTVDLLPIFPNTSGQHLAALGRSLAGFDPTHSYLHLLSENVGRASFFYGLPIAAGALAGSLAWSWFGRKFDPLHHVAGRKKKTGKDASKASALATKENSKFSPLGLKIHKDLHLTRAQEAQGILALATQGGGKTQILNHLGHHVFKRGDKCLIYDIVKCDYTREVPPDINGCEPILIAPWFSRDPNSRVAWWNIAKDIKDEQDARAFARGLIPLGGDNPMWALASRSILVAIFIKLIHEQGQNWGWTDLKNLCYLPVEELKPIAEEYYLPALISVADAESKTTNSIMINLHAFMSIIFDLEKCWGGLDKRGFSFVNWLFNDDVKYRNVILQGDLSREDLSAGYIRAVTELLVNKMASPTFTSSQKRRIWFFLDELKQVGKLECLIKLLEVGRSRGICTVLAMQSIYQLQEIYGKDAMAVYKAVTGLKIFGTIKGDDEQNFVSAVVGKRTIQRRNISQSGSGDGKINQSQSWSSHEEIDVFHPTEYEQLGPVAYGKPDDNSKKFIRGLIVGHGKEALVLEWPLFIGKEYRDANGELLSNKKIRLAQETKVLAEPDSRPVQLHPLSERVPTDNPLEILPPETPNEIKNDSTPAIVRTESDLQSTLLNLFENQSGVPSEYSDRDDAVQEIAGTIAGNAMTSAVSHAIGLPEPVIDIVENILDLSNEDDQELTGIIAHNTNKKKTRKPRKYGHQNEV